MNKLKEISLEGEVWGDVPMYEGYYMVSNLGRMYSVERVDSRNHKRGGFIMSVGSNPCGYEICALAKEGLVKGSTVHRLVATVFIDNPNNKPQINHIDGDKKNNKVTNLEWVTASENQLHSINVLGNKINEDRLRHMWSFNVGVKNRKSKLCPCTVREIRVAYLIGISPTEIGKKYNVGTSTIHRACSKSFWKEVSDVEVVSSNFI